MEILRQSVIKKNKSIKMVIKREARILCHTLTPVVFLYLEAILLNYTVP